MDENEIAEALGELETKALGRIDAVEKKLTDALKNFDSAFGEAEKRMIFGGSPNEVRSDSLPRATPEERKAVESGIRELLRGNPQKAGEHFADAMRKSNLAGSDPDGGYLVSETIGDMQRIPAEVSPLSALARTIPLTEGTVYSEPVDKDLAGAAWVGETDARPDTTTPKLADLRIECGELYAMPKASQTLIDSARIDVISWLTAKIQEAFGVAEDVAFFTGNGIVKPRGILTYPVALQGDTVRPWGTIEYVKTGVDGAFPAPTTTVSPGDPLIDLVAALKPLYRVNARFLMSRSSGAACRKLKDSEGRFLWSEGLIAGQPDRLLGYPVAYSESMPAIGVDSLSIAFGDFQRAYTVVRKLGVKLLSDPYTDKPNVRLYGYQRVGGGVSNFEALKFLKFGDS
jgi:HK97 family phage major capsid protein